MRVPVAQLTLRLKAVPTRPPTMPVTPAINSHLTKVHIYFQAALDSSLIKFMAYQSFFSR